jgi:nucleoside-diphosphate-sugar epimerase
VRRRKKKEEQVAYLVTGAAGFIGFHTCRKLLDRGESVVGVDVVNDYYDPALKEARLAILTQSAAFSFHRVDVADRGAMESVAASHPDITRIIHLAAQAGVRYSLVNPYSYTRSNTSFMRVPPLFTARMRSFRFPSTIGSIIPSRFTRPRRRPGS